MRTGAGERLSSLAKRGERLRTMPDGNAATTRLGELGVFLGNGARYDNRIKIIGKICRIVPDHDIDTSINKTLGGTRLLHVRAADCHAA